MYSTLHSGTISLKRDEKAHKNWFLSEYDIIGKIEFPPPTDHCCTLDP